MIIPLLTLMTMFTDNMSCIVILVICDCIDYTLHLPRLRLEEPFGTSLALPLTKKLSFQNTAISPHSHSHHHAPFV
jgi:hypothetical protein